MTYAEEKAAALSRVKAILASHDIKMDVSGCGCCESPSVTFVYNGETIIDDGDASFTMEEPTK